MKVKCEYCRRLFNPARQKEKITLRNATNERVKTVLVKCPHCQGLNRILVK